MTTRLILIGEAPSRRGDPEKPLSAPRTRARLVEVFGEPAYEAAEKVNLLPAWPGEAAGKGSAFPLAEARAAAEILLGAWRSRPSSQNAAPVLLGRRVAAAFGCRTIPPLLWAGFAGDVAFAMLPHPSGVDRWWNSIENRAAAREFGRRTVMEILA